jgi:hypothetical protein
MLDGVCPDTCMQGISHTKAPVVLRACVRNRDLALGDLVLALSLRNAGTARDLLRLLVH